MSPVRHLYIHIPFCAKVCPYCSFYVHGGGADRHKRFIEALCRDIQIKHEHFPLELETIYIGGGTPSMISAPLFHSLSQALHKITRSNVTPEITLEVNPATVTEAKAIAWKEAGVNRISLGAQSFNTQSLQSLGRQHQPEDVPLTIQQLRSLEFKNINIDLIFGLPWESNAEWIKTLSLALECHPDHLSAYGLTYEEDTPFFNRLNAGEWRRSEEDEIEHFLKTESMLESAGLRRYEISNFSKQGFESRHNQAYWSGKDYLGIGPSAVSTLDGKRITTAPNTDDYIRQLLSNNLPVESIELLTPEIRHCESILLGLRTREGIPLHLVESKRRVVDQLISNGMMEVTETHIKLTPQGRLVADCIAGELAY